MKGAAAAWQPSASLEALRGRAAILARLRAFFAARGILEVETPALSAATVQDLHLHSLSARSTSAAKAAASICRPRPSSP